MIWALAAILLLVASFALITAIWKILTELFTKVIKWVFSSAIGIIGLIALFWIATKFCHH